MIDHCVTSLENIELENEELYLSVENYNKSIPRGKQYLKVRSLIIQNKKVFIKYIQHFQLDFSKGELLGTVKIFFQFRLLKMKCFFVV